MSLRRQKQLVIGPAGRRRHEAYLRPRVWLHAQGSNEAAKCQREAQQGLLIRSVRWCLETCSERYKRYGRYTVLYWTERKYLNEHHRHQDARLQRPSLERVEL